MPHIIHPLPVLSHITPGPKMGDILLSPNAALKFLLLYLGQSEILSGSFFLSSKSLLAFNHGFPTPWVQTR